MHPYFTFKDLVTIFLFFLALSTIVCFYPNLLGQLWPTIMLLIVYIIYTCAISWKYILNNYLVKIYNKTILISEIFIKNLFRSLDKKNLKAFLTNKGFVPCLLFLNISPNIVRYYYKVYNQQITKVINLFNGLDIFTNKYFLLIIIKKIINIYLVVLKSLLHIIYKFNYKVNYLLQVGISETIRTHKNISNFNKNRIVNKNRNYIVKGKRFMCSHNTTKNLNTNNLIQNENIYDSHNNQISLNFKQWFAGITDGDGYIYVNKKGYVGYEITLPTSDEKVLRMIQNKFGGNIKARSGVKAVRYRTQNKESVSKIINCLNGLIINNIRLTQLHKACVALNIPIKEPIKPTINSHYISGLLDSDGSLNIFKHKYNDTYRYQLTISITNKSRNNIEFLLDIFGGNIYFDKSKNGCYIWKANSRLLHNKLYEYFLKFPPKTIKKHRTYLIKEFHELNDLKVYRETDILSMNFKKWKRFITQWENKN
jgi:ubiquinol-cytochrome c reductase cytochrome b subunit